MTRGCLAVVELEADIVFEVPPNRHRRSNAVVVRVGRLHTIHELALFSARRDSRCAAAGAGGTLRLSELRFGAWSAVHLAYECQSPCGVRRRQARGCGEPRRLPKRS